MFFQGLPAMTATPRRTLSALLLLGPVLACASAPPPAPQPPGGPPSTTAEAPPAAPEPSTAVRPAVTSDRLEALTQQLAKCTRGKPECVDLARQRIAEANRMLIAVLADGNIREPDALDPLVILYPELRPLIGRTGQGEKSQKQFLEAFKQALKLRSLKEEAPDAFEAMLKDYMTSGEPGAAATAASLRQDSLLELSKVLASIDATKREQLLNPALEAFAERPPDMSADIKRRSLRVIMLADDPEQSCGRNPVMSGGRSGVPGDGTAHFSAGLEAYLTRTNAQMPPTYVANEATFRAKYQEACTDKELKDGKPAAKCGAVLGIKLIRTGPDEAAPVVCLKFPGQKGTTTDSKHCPGGRWQEHVGAPFKLGCQSLGRQRGAGWQVIQKLNELMASANNQPLLEITKAGPPVNPTSCQVRAQGCRGGIATRLHPRPGRPGDGGL